jgi:hypothetical protein
MPIPENHETDILQSGIHFMRSITEAYGAEEGMKLWDTIASTLDPDIKGKIFFAMLLGEYNDRLTIQLDMVKYRAHVQRVEGIKAIRTVTGLGLKEAKDIHDNMTLGKVEKITIEPTRRSEAIKHLASVHIIAH